MKCEDFAERISEFADGDLTEQARYEAQEHLVQCPKCAEEYRKFCLFTNGIGQLAEPSPSDHVRYEIMSGILSRSREFPEVMDVETLMAYLGVTLEELEEELEDLPAFEFAGKLRFRKTRIDKWIEERESLRRQRMNIIHYRKNLLGASAV